LRRWSFRRDGKGSSRKKEKIAKDKKKLDVWISFEVIAKGVGTSLRGSP
jgi:hypothetical protein